MKLTKQQLKQLIKEELSAGLLEEQSHAQTMLQKKAPMALQELKEYIDKAGPNAQMSISTGGGTGGGFEVRFIVTKPAP